MESNRREGINKSILCRLASVKFVCRYARRIFLSEPCRTTSDPQKARLPSSILAKLPPGSESTVREPLLSCLTKRQSVGAITFVTLAASGVLIATASNNAVKAFYAFGFLDRKTDVQSLCFLLVFSALGLAPLSWTLT